ncbi:MAG: hypothetical protein AAF798_13000 [Bacteroidota bacterium]
MPIKKTCFFICMLLLSVPLFAQQEDQPLEAQLNGNLQVGVPLGLFNDNLDNVGIGGGGLVVFRIANTPIYAGLELSGMTYGNETQDFAISIAGFIELYELRTTNNFFLGHAMLRFKPDIDFFIQPYIDGMIGTKNLYTRTRLTNQNQNNPDQDSRIEQGDWAFSYGGAFGIQLDIFGSPYFTLDLRCAYLPGTNADYLVRRANDTNITYDDPIDAFEQRNSPTDLLLPQIGLTINISGMEE